MAGRETKVHTCCPLVWCTDPAAPPQHLPQKSTHAHGYWTESDSQSGHILSGYPGEGKKTHTSPREVKLLQTRLCVPYQNCMLSFLLVKSPLSVFSLTMMTLPSAVMTDTLSASFIESRAIHTTAGIQEICTHQNEKGYCSPKAPKHPETFFSTRSKVIFRPRPLSVMCFFSVTSQNLFERSRRDVAPSAVVTWKKKRR